MPPGQHRIWPIYCPGGIYGGIYLTKSCGLPLTFSIPRKKAGHLGLIVVFCDLRRDSISDINCNEKYTKVLLLLKVHLY